MEIPDNIDSFAYKVFTALDMHWQANAGMTRPGYSLRENEAIKAVMQFLPPGVTVHQDLAGNTYMVMAGEDNNLPAFMMGSHLDSVNNGGRFDGAAGVVAGVTVMNSLHNQQVTPRQPVITLIPRCEESPGFDQFAVGSKLACGQLGPDFLQRAGRDNRTLESHMIQCGLNPDPLVDCLNTGTLLIPKESIGAFVEPHIEQCWQLSHSDTSLGLVTAIRGNLRFSTMFDFPGTGGHTGTVPQPDRDEASIKLARFVCEVDKELEIIKQKGHDIVWAFPEFDTPGSQPTSLCKQALGRVEVRSTDIKILEAAREIIFQAAGRYISQHNLPEARISTPVQTHGQLVSELSTVCKNEGIPYMQLASGAGHDASVLAEAGIPAAMIFIKQDVGHSHMPEEDMDGESFNHCVRVLERMALSGKYPNSQRQPLTFTEALKERGATQLHPG